ncbi:MAG: IclR family transcriptional regulator [Pseudomonadota bacterium]
MSDGERIPTNVRPLLILEALSSADGPMTTAELGRAVGLPKPTIHRLCASMLDANFLSRDHATRGLRPGRRAREIATGLLHNVADATARRQILTQVSETVKETVNFAAPSDNGMTYVDRVETDWAFRIQLPIGAIVPFHRTASGKTYLASLPPAQRAKMAHSLDFSDGTPNAHKSPESLLTELEAIAKRGFALDNEELLEGMVALAVPICDKRRRYFASLAFHGPNQRLNADSMVAHLDTMRNAAEKLSDLLA